MRRQIRLFLYLLSVIAPAGGAYAQLAANFTASPTSGCAPMVVTFTSTSTGSPTTYSWSFGNSLTSTLQNPTTSYTVPGTYAVTLTVGNGTSSNTITKTAYITVKQPPTVTFTGSNLWMCP
jgi:PKD repeat protein